MKLYAVVCEALARESYHAASKSPHVVTISVKAFGLHNEPDKLRASLQAETDGASDAGYDAVVMGYGLCSLGTAGLVARDIPVVIARAHDCITHLLGSREAYQREFAEHPGTYYYSPGWIERKEGEVNQGGVSIVQDEAAKQRYQEYVDLYGEDNAQYLMDQESQWLAHYNRAAFINMGIGHIEHYREFTRAVAESHGWTYEELPGDTRLMDLLLRGDWDPAEFLIVQPGQKTYEDVNSGIISAA